MFKKILDTILPSRRAYRKGYAQAQREFMNRTCVVTEYPAEHYDLQTHSVRQHFNKGMHESMAEEFMAKQIAIGLIGEIKGKMKHDKKQINSMQDRHTASVQFMFIEPRSGI